MQKNKIAQDVPMTQGVPAAFGVQMALPLDRRRFLQLGGGLALAAGLGVTGMPALAQGDGTLTMAIPSDTGGWDFDYLAFDLIGLALLKNTYPHVLDYNTREVAGGEIQDTESVLPVFAESWEPDADGKVWTLKLKQGLTFPSGNPFTARDVKWSKDRAFAANANVAGLYRIVGLTSPDQVELVDDYTVRFTQPGPSAMTSQIQIICLYVFDSELVKSHATADDPWAKDWVNRTPQLGGAFNVTSYEPGQEIVMEANAAFPVGAPAIPRVRFQIIPAAANRRLLLENGDIDIAHGLSRRDIADLRSNPKIKVISAPSNEFWFVPMATQMAPFDNPKVRQALAHAVPYEAIITSVFNGESRRSQSPVPLDMPGSSPAGYPFDTDPEKAKALLAEAGHPDGFETEIVIVANDTERERIAILLQAAFKQIGVTLNISTVDPATMQSRNRERSVPLQVASGQMWVNDIEYLISTSMSATGFLNYASYKSDVIDAIALKLHDTVEPAPRQALCDEAQATLAADVPWLMLGQPNFELPVSAGLDGWVQPVDGLFRLRYLTQS